MGGRAWRDRTAQDASILGKEQECRIDGPKCVQSFRAIPGASSCTKDGVELCAKGIALSTNMAIDTMQ